ncbi:hypothetical protein L218DRAFT_1072265 [Marasmius fiardii PR-910]|nr:hypothetical protein L218DRAFT_1072265 [Marasmius fiardii PR-910]
MLEPAHISSILHNHPNQARDIPFIPVDRELQAYVEDHSLVRTPVIIQTSDESSREWAVRMKGVSMKKAHEITRLASYIRSLPSNISRDYVVDIGSGQGYLHRVLSAKEILALDSDEHQTTGAEAREKRVKKGEMRVDSNTRVTHKTLDITPDGLLTAVDEWIESFAWDSPSSTENRIPVLMVALHACGSLHIDALQAFIRASEEYARDSRWYFSGAVTVPCCYNLLRPDHFPISSQGENLLREFGLPHPLPASAYHLAAQGELEARNKQKWELGVRKVIWRSLVGPILEDVAVLGTSVPLGIGAKEFIAPSEFSAYKNVKAPTPRRNLKTIAAPTFRSLRTSMEPLDLSSCSRPVENELFDLENDTSGIGTSVLFQRLGKLPNTAYESWDVFMDHVERRLYPSSPEASNVSHPVHHTPESANPIQNQLPRTHSLYADVPSDPPSSKRARELERLHMARCSLGPVIETVILEDRRRWIEEQLTGSSVLWEVSLVPLFDQKKGSARNIGLIVIPVKSG